MRNIEICSTHLIYMLLALRANCILSIIYRDLGLLRELRALSKSNNAGFLGARDASSPSKPCVIAAHGSAMPETGNEIGTDREKRKWA